MKVKTASFYIIFLTLIFCSLVQAEPKQSWRDFVSGVRQEALAQGIRPEVFDAAFKDLKEPQKTVLNLSRTQPEKRLAYLKYRDSRADNYRIVIGKRQMKKYSDLLTEIGNKYGVSQCFIVSLWGLESSYGTFMGSFPVIKSLASLAYASHRQAFFREQLLLALHIVNDGHVKLEDYKGEWAGASGQPQFMPSSFRNYAVDYRNRGRKDIWKTPEDVFASIANYLVKNGWQRNQPSAIEVEIPSSITELMMSRDISKTVQEWERLGVHPAPGFTFPQNTQILASIIQPEGGPTLMTFNNFNVIMRWNHSIYYAGTVGYMADKICGRHV